MCASVAGFCAFIMVGSLRPFHWSYTWFIAVQLTFDFDVKSLSFMFQKNPGATVIAPVQKSYILAQQFVCYLQVQSEVLRLAGYTPL